MKSEIPDHAFWNPQNRLPEPPQSRLRDTQRQQLAKVKHVKINGDMGLAWWLKQKTFEIGGDPSTSG